MKINELFNKLIDIEINDSNFFNNLNKLLGTQLKSKELKQISELIRQGLITL